MNLLHILDILEKRISAISTGIGTDNIDIVLNELDALVNMDLESGQELKEKTSLNLDSTRNIWHNTKRDKYKLHCRFILWIRY